MNEKPTEGVHSRDHLIFIIVTLIYWISLYIYVPILAPYLESLGATYTFVGIVLGSYGLMQIFIRLPLGIYSDRLRKRRPFIALGLLTSAVSCFCFAFTDQLGWGLAARAISGISASTWVAFTVLYASYYAKNETAKAMGTISLITVSGQLLGMGISGLLAEQWGWHSTFLAGGIIALIGFAAAFAIKEPREGISRKPIQMKGLLEVMKSVPLWKVSILSIMAHGILFITMFGFTPSQAIALGASKSQLSLLVFAFMIPHACSAFLSGRWIAPKFGSWPTVIAGFLFSAFTTAAISISPSFNWLLVTQSINGFAQGLHMPLLMGLAIQYFDQDKRATAMGLFQAVYAIGMFGGPFMAGWLNQTAGLVSGFYFGGVVGIVAAGLAYYWSKQENSGIVQHQPDSLQRKG